MVGFMQYQIVRLGTLRFLIRLKAMLVSAAILSKIAQMHMMQGLLTTLRLVGRPRASLLHQLIWLCMLVHSNPGNVIMATIKDKLMVRSEMRITFSMNMDLVITTILQPRISAASISFKTCKLRDTTRIVYYPKHTNIYHL
jgi:hypothetical protein